MRIRNTRFRFVPGQNGPHQSAFCQGAATTFRAGVTLPDRQEGDDRTGRGISDQEHARLKKTDRRFFGRVHGVYFRRGSPPEKGRLFQRSADRGELRVKIVAKVIYNRAMPSAIRPYSMAVARNSSNKPHEMAPQLCLLGVVLYDPVHIQAII